MSLTAAAIGLGAAGVAGNLIGSAINYKAQKDNLAWQKDIQRDIFAREDTSIARRVADLQASGLSPVLAAGQGAGTGGVVSTNAPQLDLPDTSMMAINMLKQEADISATRAQEEYTNLQKKNAEMLLPAQLASMESQIKNADAQTYKTYQDAKKAKVEADNMVKTGTSGSNTFSQWYRDLFGGSNKAIDNLKSDAQKKAKGEIKVKGFTPFWTKEGKDKIKQIQKNRR